MRTEKLSNEERQRIHEAALEILESVGVQVSSAPLLRRLEERGLRTLEGQRLSLPRRAVEKALACAPKSVPLGGRRGANRTARLEGKRVFATTDGCGARAIDFDSGERRPSALRDVAASARLTDALDQFDVYWTMVSAQDVPRSERVARGYLAALQNTTKHVQIIDAGRPSEAETLARMAHTLTQAGAVEEHAVSMLISVVTPLRLDPTGTEAALIFAREGLPVVACSMPIAGVTAPATAAGMVLLGHAEVMAFITIIQILHPGAPVIYCLFPAFGHARTGETNYADPRKGWTAGAAVQLARPLGVPCFTSGEGPALELAPDLISGGGLLETSTLLRYEQMVIDNEALRALRMAAAAQDTGPDGLALDVIREVGPGGHFLAQKHTARHMKGFLVPRYIEVDAGAIPPSGGEPAGAAGERARREAQRLLRDHRVEPLPAELEARLEAIVQECPATAA